MKTIINKKFFILIALAAFALLFACENPWMEEVIEEKIITFDAMGGIPVPPSQRLLKGERVTRPSVDPIKTDSIFLGWYENNGSLYDFNSIPTNSMTLYAGWNDNACTVTFESNGGSIVPARIVEKGEPVNRPNDPTSPHAYFIGWYDNVSLNEPQYNFDTPVLENITLYAKWNKSSYIVTFIGYNSVFLTQTALEGSNISKPSPDPTTSVIAAGLYLGEPKAMGFNGWYNADTLFDFDSTPITADITLTAQWISTAIDLSSQSESNVFEKAILYVNNYSNTNSGYNLLLDSSNVNGNTVSLSGNCKLTVTGLSMVTIWNTIEANSNFALTIGNNITCDSVYIIDRNASIVLTGTAKINNLVLRTSSQSAIPPVVNIASGWEGSVTKLDMKSFDSSMSSISDIIAYWLGKPVLQAASGYTLQAADVEKFTLGEFISSHNTTTSMSISECGYKIADSGADIGKLVTKTFTSIAGLATYLSFKPENTTATPYTVKLNVSSFGGGSNTEGSLGCLLKNNNKYVNLDLSGSILNNIEENAFNNCFSLTGITIPNGINSINMFAFQACINLNSVTIPNSVESIGNCAFNNCTGLTSITIGNGVNKIGYYAF